MTRRTKHQADADLIALAPDLLRMTHTAQASNAGASAPPRENLEVGFLSFQLASARRRTIQQLEHLRSEVEQALRSAATWDAPHGGPLNLQRIAAAAAEIHGLGERAVALSEALDVTRAANPPNAGTPAPKETP